ncbi:tegument protein/FGARAT [Cricetid gammaherpesvirus 2]|uniref:Tegument protein/FGARAT n=1 Tax=Cricetid gammaherpesvirus 2 TaxID=1605972 RepID=E9M5Q9_9GAMA|nr:tegument protein/FGARAT [Cricetid gammaherpesvirus 2]ADW24417.1 tegument protein/FGARAT [Cricetid gammaherpesvirus 2]ADW24499.1 tegument protein/FGARAT [Cricetid gammaherpesvirus 2]
MSDRELWTISVYGHSRPTPNERSLWANISSGTIPNSVSDVQAGHVLTLNVVIDKNERHSEEAAQRFMAIASFILACKSRPPFLESPKELKEVIRSDPKVFNFIYGNPPNAAPTTWTRELVNILKFIDPSMIARVDCVRRLHGNSGDQASTSLVLLNLLNCFTASQFATQLTQEHLLNMAIAPYENQPDVTLSSVDTVTQLMMFPVNPQQPSICLAHSIGNYPVSSIYPTLLSSFKNLVFESNNSSPQLINSLYHVHNETSQAGYMLSHVNFSSSWLPGCSLLAAYAGFYVSSLNKQAKTGKQLMLTETAINSQINTHSSLSIPTLGGFIRPVSPKQASVDASQPLTVLVSKIILTAIRPEQLNPLSRDAAHLEYAVCLGDFMPVLSARVPPYTHDHSTLEQVKIQNVMRQWIKDLGSWCYTKCIRPIYTPHVKDTLYELSHPSGLRIHIDSLPQNIKDLLKESPLNEYQEIITKHFLEAQTNQVFVLTHNLTLPLSVNQRIKIGALDHLKVLCGRYNCTINVLGTVQPSPGLVFYRVGATDSDMANTDDLLFTVKDDKTLDPSIFNIGPSNSYPRIKHCHPISWDSIDLKSAFSQILSHPAVESKEYIVRHLDRLGQAHVLQQPGCGPFDYPVSDYGAMITNAVRKEFIYPGQNLIPLTKHTAGALKDNPHSWFTDKIRTNKHKFDCIITAVGEQYLKSQVDEARGMVYGLLESLCNLVCCPYIHWPTTTVTASISWDPSHNKAGLLKGMKACRELCQHLGIKLMFVSASSSDIRPHSHTPANFTPTNVVTFLASNKGVFRGDRSKPTPDFKAKNSSIFWITLDPRLTIAGSIAQDILQDQAKSNKLLTFKQTHVLPIFQGVHELLTTNTVLSIHDISDGGLLTCLAEMCLSGGMGADVTIPPIYDYPLDVVISETPGFLVEVDKQFTSEVFSKLQSKKVPFFFLGTVTGPTSSLVTFRYKDQIIHQISLSEARGHWRQHHINDTYQKCSHLDRISNLYCLEYGCNQHNFQKLTYYLSKEFLRPCIPTSNKPIACVLSFAEQQHPETLLCALSNTGFGVMHVKNLLELEENPSILNLCQCLFISGKICSLDSFSCTLACVHSFLANETIMGALRQFLLRQNTHLLGFGELGTQLLLNLNIIELDPASRDLISCKPSDPLKVTTLQTNVSGMFESLWLNFQIWETASIFLKPLTNMVCPAWIQGTHLGFKVTTQQETDLTSKHLMCATFHQDSSAPYMHAEYYPRNPTANCMAAGFCSPDGRATALLLDPSQSFHPWQWPHVNSEEGLTTSPWQLCFYNLFLHCCS